MPDAAPKYKIVRHPYWWATYHIQDTRSGHISVFSRRSPYSMQATLNILETGRKKRHQYQWFRRKFPQQNAWTPTAVPTVTVL